jgi:hypothetical protein
VDAAVTSSLHGIVEGMGLSKIYYTKRIRRKLVGWNNVQAPIPHHNVGGVTCCTLQLGLLTKDAAPRIGRRLVLTAPRDVSTVLSVMAFARRPRNGMWTMEFAVTWAPLIAHIIMVVAGFLWLSPPRPVFLLRAFSPLKEPGEFGRSPSGNIWPARMCQSKLFAQVG